MMMDKEFRIKKKCIYLFRFCPIMLNYLIVITGAVLNHCLRPSVSRGWHRLMRHPVLCPQCSLLHEFRKKVLSGQTNEKKSLPHIMRALVRIKKGISCSKPQPFTALKIESDLVKELRGSLVLLSVFKV